MGGTGLIYDDDKYGCYMCIYIVSEERERDRERERDGERGTDREGEGEGEKERQKESQVLSCKHSRYCFFDPQVQPFQVQDNTFATAYNCIGYFTEATWMGIFTVAILLLVFYLSIVCAFSMNTIDRFEDPRGQTILVEKLH